ncbi:hypothetical protein F53441_10974 [Fusarium austroafricanum]|uniref:RING-type domain-containing protein n=1 Tax=Fusarium austroafricanum TaxID=2364996 RepID=A0A8H4K5K0_9HYPO|nr:hypothetical protein F53441_10974 [Fusarium austroafricanum]
MEDPEKDAQGTSPPFQDACIQEVTALFPDICLNYLQSVAGPLSFAPQPVINHILDLQDSGKSYEKAKRPKQAIGKRKRGEDGQDDDDDDDLQEKLLEAKRKYSNRAGLAIPKRSQQVTVIKQMIAGDFPLVPIKYIQQLLSENENHLFPTFVAINAAIDQADSDHPVPWKYKKTASTQRAQYRKESIETSIQFCQNDWEKELMKELQAARLLQWDIEEKRRAEQLAKQAEKENHEAADARGELTECQCCFLDTPWNRLVYCQGDDPHPFCINCARRNAEVQVGLSKYELECLSTDGCAAGFSHDERKKFLDKKLASAMDRIEQEANLRMAQLPNLAKCPFCHYAEEYPPVTVDREFRCRNHDCEITSCRLCNCETHIPKTCKEAALERGVDARREVEEAMSEALIRKCNKCRTAFIKQDGCNKMTCTTKGCGNVQCYVCSKSCDYDHFDDSRRGGKKGNCPLFEDVEERHEKEVNLAQQAAKKKVIEENPELAADPELLDFSMSEKVKNDDLLRRKQAGPRNAGWGLPIPQVNQAGVVGGQMPRRHHPPQQPQQDHMHPPQQHPELLLRQQQVHAQVYANAGGYVQPAQQAHAAMREQAWAQAQVHAQAQAQAQAEALFALQQPQHQHQQQRPRGFRGHLKNAVARLNPNRLRGQQAAMQAAQVQQLQHLQAQEAQAQQVQPPVAPAGLFQGMDMNPLNYFMEQYQGFPNWGNQGQQ